MITYDLIIYCRGIVIHYLIKNTLSIILMYIFYRVFKTIDE